MQRKIVSIGAAIALLPLWLVGANAADVVKVMPLEGQEGEFCHLDRTLIFDPIDLL